MALEEKVHGLRLHVIQRAAHLGNVSQACREAGISRALFYRWRRRVDRYGPDGVHPRRHQARAGKGAQRRQAERHLGRRDRLGVERGYRQHMHQHPAQQRAVQRQHKAEQAALGREGARQPAD